MIWTWVGAFFAALLGIGLILWGYRLFLVLLPVFGFLSGFWLGAETMHLIFGEAFLGTVTGWIAGFVAGLLVALFSYFFYAIGVVLIAALAGAWIGSGFMGALGLDNGLLVALVAIVAAVIVAILTLRYNLQKYVIMALTSFGGASLLIAAVMLVLGRVTLEQVEARGSAIQPILADSWFWLLVWLALAAAGVYWQLRTNREWWFDQSRYVEGWG